MAKLKLRGKDLKKIGMMDDGVIAMSMTILHKAYKFNSKQHVLNTLKMVIANPSDFLEDEKLGRIAEALVEEPTVLRQEIRLNAQPLAYKAFGMQHIEEGTTKQMDIAMQLPITAAGALMPDAHQGYGLPIGGVLATENAIIPYGVGMDIGCRMCLSVYPLRASYLENNRYELKEKLKANTRFGKKAFDRPMDDPIFDRPEFKEIPMVRHLKHKARTQIGSSGSGNHFVDFGIVTITDENNELGLATGDYVGLLSHSGSRGLGSAIAKFYTDLAMSKCLLPKAAKNLAWLDLDSADGQEYWLAMNLAGDYASACHHHIHKRMARSLGEEPLAMVENHHNFAWKETLANGKEVIVHRKGATPAGKGVLGIIPGSMTAPAFIVRGKGNLNAINSAAHGAGRAMSRTKARNSFTNKEMRQLLKKKRVDLIGGALDESPMAYKDIHQVMAAQQNLVDVIGTFLPKIVKMDRA